MSNIYTKIFESKLVEAAMDEVGDSQTFEQGFDDPADVNAINTELKKIETTESQAVQFVQKANEYYKFILEAVIPKLKQLDKEISKLIPKGLILDTPEITKVNISLYSLAEQLVGAVQKAVNEENKNKLPDTK